MFIGYGPSHKKPRAYEKKGCSNRTSEEGCLSKSVGRMRLGVTGGPQEDTVQKVTAEKGIAPG